MLPTLVICSRCHSHGHIIVPSGLVIPEFYSKPYARAVLDSAVANQVIEDRFVSHLLDKIAQSELLENDEDVDPAVITAVHIWNYIVSQSPEGTPIWRMDCMVKFVQAINSLGKDVQRSLRFSENAYLN